jgi:hypothetical protein
MVKHGRAVWFNRQERLRNCKTKRPPEGGLSAALIKAEISPLQSPPTADLFTQPLINLRSAGSYCGVKRLCTKVEIKQALLKRHNGRRVRWKFGCLRKIADPNHISPAVTVAQRRSWWAYRTLSVKTPQCRRAPGRHRQPWRQRCRSRGFRQALRSSGVSACPSSSRRPPRASGRPQGARARAPCSVQRVVLVSPSIPTRTRAGARSRLPLAVPLAVAQATNFNEFRWRVCELFHTWWGISCGNSRKSVATPRSDVALAHKLTW